MNDFVSRHIMPQIEECVNYYPTITITGPRQSGKSTMCRRLFPDYEYVSLERIATRQAAANDIESFLNSLGNKAIIDEVQHVPELLSDIQCRVDEDRSLRYILTGSSNFSLLKTVTQSLAGRTAVFTLPPFINREVKEYCRASDTNTLLFNGSYPGVIAKEMPAYDFYLNYYDSYVERDLRNLLKIGNLLTFDKFVRMLALRAGTEFNASAIAREIGVASVTINEWLSLLATSYLIFLLQPYYSNVGKRLTKTPKVYFYDTGLLCSLLGIRNPTELSSHPLRGQIFENHVAAEIRKQTDIERNRTALFFYRENRGVEVDLIKERMIGVNYELYEIKSSMTYRADFSANMKRASEVIPNVKSTTVIYDGETIGRIAVNFRDI
ncbi:ATP-binding protein [Parabacteroides sp. ZJ-118]|uniref:ATP-binding protein n=1 Tax=Parabacteroides sp. ZJ-118 TaxID=2709398 RepID=UPI0013EA490B|nr:ATP-binding protein [Parabacteroides sp. ZJ-118]